MIPVFDGHNDALTREDAEDLSRRTDRGHLDLPRMREGGVRGGIFAIFTPSAGEPSRQVSFGAGGSYSEPLAESVGNEEAAAHACQIAERLLELERRGEVVVPRSIAEVDAARDDGSPPVAVMHLEGAEAIDGNLELLGDWYERGLRSLGPVWSRANVFAHGVPFRFPSSPDTGPGLTDRGFALVAACAELGILVDLSHLNEAGFWDVARLEPGPLVASHSGVHALCPASRNLTDRQLDAIGDSDGLVGIVFATPFLRPDFADDPTTPLALIAEHARYVANRIGVAHVGLGSDFDGATIPAALGDVSGIPRLLAALESEGFGQAEIEAICWHNWRRALAAWWR
ncbi:MAG: rane dipeptidase [Solirubrobacterales bacterium]|jgi:membrane dipeptidase|nr:rane dipeptidase [Solirubrobacterales bacterium]